MRRRGNESARDANGTNGRPRRSIVVVDDDVVVPMTLTIALPETTVIEATRRRAGLERIRSEQPDAVVIDRRMPDGDGLALVRKVRSDPETCDIPVVVLTAAFDEADRPEVMKAGADAYIGKPFDPEHLLAVLEGLIEKRPPRQPRPAAQPAPERTEAGPERPHRRQPLRAATRERGTGLPPPASVTAAAASVAAPTVSAPAKDIAPAAATAPATSTAHTNGTPATKVIAPSGTGLSPTTKVAVDAVALGASLGRAEERAAAAEAEVAHLHASLAAARADNERLYEVITGLEGRLAAAHQTAEHALATAAAAGDHVDAENEELRLAREELEQLRRELSTARRGTDEMDQLQRELSQAYEELEILSRRLESGVAAAAS